MAARRLLLTTLSRSSSVTSSTGPLSLLAKHTAPSIAPYPRRWLSSGKDGDDDSNKNDPSDDPFGVNFDDGSDKLGPDTPPLYKRDSVTGKFTGEQEVELTPQERQLLQMDPVQEEEYLVQKLASELDLDDENEEEDSRRRNAFSERVRRDNMGVNTIGRSVQAQSLKGILEDGESAYKDPSGFSKPLSPSEFEVFKAHVKKEYKADVDPDDIPVESVAGSTHHRLEDGGDDDDFFDDVFDSEELSSEWMSSKAVRFMDDMKDDDPFAELLPADLSPSKLVNRRNVKPIPRQLLHHNNLSLLRRYITPTGQVMNRVHSRLGAKDQRRIAKLIKRARALGLIPHAGQFVVESHGSIHEQDIHEDREWEKELARRGLVIQSQK